MLQHVYTLQIVTDHNSTNWKMRPITQVDEEFKVEDLQEGETVYLCS